MVNNALPEAEAPEGNEPTTKGSHNKLERGWVVGEMAKLSIWKPIVFKGKIRAS